MAFVYGGIAWVVLRRRESWIRFLDAEAAWWRRIGLPKLSFDRRLGESRFFTYSLVFSAGAFFLMAVAAAVLYLRLSHHAH